ncbi:hypothetical protein [Tritonibacter mobilis]|uniref:hypothetical protein n=1 Tax=Tritonibacter mobilis TaxID=379347 RepID=UPI001C0968E7|nr:hypothetical protein [Tritonibacter mobilis]MBU3033760.1 hypothetical protein [Tritonibacter mobilis]WHQ84813.1 hypothetical protein OMR53_16385 [Tritonibacter mobilis]
MTSQAKEEFHRSPQEIAQCISFPTITTIRSRIKAISEVVRVIGRGGKRHATNVKGPGSTDVRALAFGEKFETDQCLLSIFTSGDGVVRAKVMDPKQAPQELADNEVRRCWLHLSDGWGYDEALWLVDLMGIQSTGTSRQSALRSWIKTASARAPRHASDGRADCP